MLIFEDKITANRQQFVDKVIHIAELLDINPNWLMGVMKIESGMNPAAVNSITGATGLIQFMPATALSLGTTTQALRGMSNLQQLDYVYLYFKPYRNHITKFEDLYLITLYPNAGGVFAGTLDQDDSWAFPDSVRTANRGIDINTDGKLTISDVKQWAMSKIPMEKIPEFTVSIDAVQKFAARNIIMISLVSLSIGIGTYLYMTA